MLTLALSWLMAAALTLTTWLTGPLPAGPRPAARVPTPNAAPHPLSEDLTRYAESRSDTFSVGVFDEQSHQFTAYRPTDSYDNASIVKVNILETVMWQAQRAHRWLSTWEQEQGVHMIRHSDNDAASALWRHVGGAGGVRAYDRTIAVKGTSFDPGGAWGLTRSIVQDQTVLIRAVGSGVGPLSARSRSFVRFQMSHVEPDQWWGVSAGVPLGALVELKNGWLPRSSHGWRINSIGHVRDSSHDYDIAVLSTNNPSMRYGVDTVQEVSRLVYRDLGRR